jgi:hypothetical protein
MGGSNVIIGVNATGGVQTKSLKDFGGDTVVVTTLVCLYTRELH